MLVQPLCCIIDTQGNVVEAGTTNYGVNVAGFMSHSAIHANRPDLKCVLHLRHPPVTAVSGKLKFLVYFGQ